MALSYDLLSQFAKLVSTPAKTSTESTVYGTVVDENGSKYVRLDGSEVLIPLSDSSVDVKADERVSATIKDHTLTVTGNISSPAGRNSDVVDVKNAGILLADRVQTAEASITKLKTDTAEIGDLKTATAQIQELVAQKADIKDLTAAVGRIDTLESTQITTDILDAKYAKITDLNAINADISELEAGKASVEQLQARDAEIANLKIKDAAIENLVAEKASVEQLNAANAEIVNLKTKDAEIEGLVAKKADIEQLNAIDATIKNLNANYADIDFSNINMAAVEELFTKSGIINNLTVGDTSITGELVGVTIRGDRIIGGTVTADKLVVKGSDGLYYKLNVEAGGISAEEAPTDSLHGSVITAKSITAEKVSVKDLVAFGATIGGFHITDKAIHSGAKGSVDADSIRGVYLDSEGQFAVGDEKNFFKYYYDITDGKYKLEIAADQFKLSTGKTLEESVADNLEIGARNLIRNSKTMIFADYYFEDAGNEEDETVLDIIIADQEAILAEQEAYMGTISEIVNVESSATTIEDVLDETLVKQTEILDHQNTFIGGASD